ncbi:YbhN family protein [Mucilaginibacter sp. AW1-7]|uniref:lysylphosphatidylglycerol synthase transmembrane domain-containing protein n=1 Tax=Mucilaginibacter sp. AW1-7 TaxID=3349874 RepID=UPI003F735B6E
MVDPKKQQLFSPARILFYTPSIVIFYLAVHYVGKLKNIRELLQQMSTVWLLLALTAQLATYMFNVLILRTLLNGQTGSASFLTLFKLSVVIMFVNQALPTGGISGNGYIFGQLVKRKVPALAAFKALVLESICYYIAFLVLSGSFYAWYADHTVHVSSVINYTVITGFVFFTALGILMLIISDRRALAFILRKLNQFKWLRRFIAKASPLYLTKSKQKNWRALHEPKKPVAMAVLLQMGIITLDAITVFAILQGFHVMLNPCKVMFGLLLTLAIGSLPVSPGALIAYESAMTFFFTLLGVPVHAALIVTLLFRFFTFWLPMPAGLFLYRDLRRRQT